MKLLNVAILVLLTSTAVNAAGKNQGTGSYIISCDAQTYSYDVREGLDQGFIPNMPSGNYDQKVRELIHRTKEMSEIYAEVLLKAYESSFYKWYQSEHLGHNVEMTSISFFDGFYADVSEGSLKIPSGCKGKIEQVSTQLYPKKFPFPKEVVYQISRPMWKNLNASVKAAITMHELVRTTSGLSKYSETGSVRHLVSRIIAKELPTNARATLEFRKKLGWPLNPIQLTVKMNGQKYNEKSVHIETDIYKIQFLEDGNSVSAVCFKDGVDIPSNLLTGKSISRLQKRNLYSSAALCFSTDNEVTLISTADNEIVKDLVRYNFNVTVSLTGITSWDLNSSGIQIDTNILSVSRDNYLYQLNFETGEETLTMTTNNLGIDFEFITAKLGINYDSNKWRHAQVRNGTLYLNLKSRELYLKNSFIYLENARASYQCFPKNGFIGFAGSPLNNLDCAKLSVWKSGYKQEVFEDATLIIN